MIQIENTRQIRMMVVEKDLRRKARNLTLHLMTALQIEPHGRHLVYACGTGSEHDNCEAVYGWVLDQVCCASCIREVSFEKLQRRFVTHLVNFSNCEVYYE